MEDVIINVLDKSFRFLAENTTFCLVVFYILFILITYDHSGNDVWSQKLKEINEREQRGEYVCLERIMVNVSMFTIAMLMPFILLFEWATCSFHKK